MRESPSLVSFATREPKAKPLAEQAKSLPDHPGVYLMRDAAGKVIHIGKAAEE